MIGATLAHDRITAALGAGGMGEVYRATDTRLGREVALKVRPEGFAQDPERLARFEREAKVLASLNHPIIAHPFGLETGASGADADEGSSLRPQTSSFSSRPAAGTAAPPSGLASPEGIVGHASRVAGREAGRTHSEGLLRGSSVQASPGEGR